MEEFEEELLYVEFLDTNPNENINKIVSEELRNDDIRYLDDHQFLTRYRMSKGLVLKMLDEIESKLEYPTDRNHPLTPIQQILVTLRYLATGSFQLVMGDVHGVSKSTVCRYITKVSNAIASLSSKYIKFPTGNEILNCQKQFYKIAEFPGIVGAIDCTHVPISKVGGNLSEIFRNRKGYFSINVQTICDANLIILDIIARWPGSVHDSTIFDNSYKMAQFEQKKIEGILLGDNGYGLRPYLMTPLLNPTTEAEEMYNKSHKSTRNVIERSYGVMKKRFPVLKLGMRTKLKNTLCIIVACAVLHNIAILSGENEPPEDMVLAEYIQSQRVSMNCNYIDYENINEVPYHNVPYRNVPLHDTRAHSIRRAIIEGHFSTQ